MEPPFSTFISKLFYFSLDDPFVKNILNFSESFWFVIFLLTTEKLGLKTAPFWIPIEHYVELHAALDWRLSNWCNFAPFQTIQVVGMVEGSRTWWLWWWLCCKWTHFICSWQARTLVQIPLSSFNFHHWKRLKLKLELWLLRLFVWCVWCVEQLKWYFHFCWNEYENYTFEWLEWCQYLELWKESGNWNLFS